MCKSYGEKSVNFTEKSVKIKKKKGSVYVAVIRFRKHQNQHNLYSN